MAVAMKLGISNFSTEYLRNAVFCNVLHESKQKRKQTQENAQYGLEILFIDKRTWK